MATVSLTSSRQEREGDWIHLFLLSPSISPVSLSPSSEVQYVVLQNVATMTIKRRVSYTWWYLLVVYVWNLKSNADGAADSFSFLSSCRYVSQGMFEPYLKSFYIRSTDPTQIKVLKVLFYSSFLFLFYSILALHRIVPLSVFFLTLTLNKWRNVKSLNSEAC